MKDSQGIQKCAQIRTHLWHFMPGLMVFIFFANKKPGQPQIDRWQGGWETWGERKMFRTPLEKRGTYQEIWKKLTGKPLRALLTSEIYECILASTCEVNSCFLKLLSTVIAVPILSLEVPGFLLPEDKDVNDLRTLMIKGDVNIYWVLDVLGIVLSTL